MPYIKKVQRRRLENQLENPVDVGELNYCITLLLINYWTDHHNYQGINDILGALEGAKLEFYRRVALPYEDRKLEANGDVY